MLGHVPESQWGTLKTIQQDHLSRDDMTELLCHLQAIALSKSHLIETLIRQRRLLNFFRYIVNVLKFQTLDASP